MPAVRIQSGIGGVILRSPSARAAAAEEAAEAAAADSSAATGDASFPSSGISPLVVDPLSSLRWNSDSTDSFWLSGLGTPGRLSLRRRLRLCMLRILWRSEMTRPASGAAKTMVPGVAVGGGVGESDRKSGWMCASLCDRCCVKPVRCDWIVPVDPGLGL